MHPDTLSVADLEDIALRLVRRADHVEQVAARVRHGTSPSWRGEAAERHRARVAEHASDLTVLADSLRNAAAAVDLLAATAREHVDLLLDAAELAWSAHPVMVLP